MIHSSLVHSSLLVALATTLPSAVSAQCSGTFSGGGVITCLGSETETIALLTGSPVLTANTGLLIEDDTTGKHTFSYGSMIFDSCSTAAGGDCFVDSCDSPCILHIPDLVESVITESQERCRGLFNGPGELFCEGQQFARIIGNFIDSDFTSTGWLIKNATRNSTEFSTGSLIWTGCQSGDCFVDSCDNPCTMNIPDLGNVTPDEPSGVCSGSFAGAGEVTCEANEYAILVGDMSDTSISGHFSSMTGNEASFSAKFKNGTMSWTGCSGDECTIDSCSSPCKLTIPDLIAAATPTPSLRATAAPTTSLPSAATMMHATGSVNTMLATITAVAWLLAF
jgi:hypothetical protein